MVKVNETITMWTILHGELSRVGRPPPSELLKAQGLRDSGRLRGNWHGCKIVTAPVAAFFVGGSSRLTSRGARLFNVALRARRLPRLRQDCLEDDHAWNMRCASYIRPVRFRFSNSYWTECIYGTHFLYRFNRNNSKGKRYSDLQF